MTRAALADGAESGCASGLGQATDDAASAREASLTSAPVDAMTFLVGARRAEEVHISGVGKRRATAFDGIGEDRPDRLVQPRHRPWRHLR